MNEQKEDYKDRRSWKTAQRERAEEKARAHLTALKIGWSRDLLLRLELFVLYQQAAWRELVSYAEGIANPSLSVSVDYEAGEQVFLLKQPEP